MRRRQVLAALGAAGVGGCLSGRPSGASDTTSAATSSGSPSTATSTSETTTLSPQERCPPGGDDVARVVCYDAIDPTEADMYLEPSRDGVELPAGEVSFALANDTDREFTTNFYAWRVWKREAGDWFHVAPRGWPAPAMVMEPGDSHSWTLGVDNTDLDRRIPPASGTEGDTVVGLGGGTYAFGVAGWFADDDHDHQTLFAAGFGVRGDPLPLEPLSRVSVVGRDGGTLTVSDPHRRGDDRRATYVATRVADPDGDPRPLITEQVIRDTDLRNALAFFEEGVRQVRLRAYTTTTPAFGVQEPEFVAYDGVTYRITTEDTARE